MLSNRVLAWIVVSALVVSLAGSFLSLGVFSRLSPALPSTGLATSTQSVVNISVQNTLSIILDDSVIDFQGCRPGEVVFSNVSGGNNESACPTFSGDHIIVRNDGTNPVNLSVNFSDWGEAQGGSFLNASSDDSWVAYGARNESNMTLFSGGCSSGLVQGWSVVGNSAYLQVCDQLVSDVVSNSVTFNIAFFIPDAIGARQSELEVGFIASPG